MAKFNEEYRGELEVNKNISSSLEDYLEALYLIYIEHKIVKAIDISRALNVSRASTTEALKKLAEKNLINYGRYGVISITDEGAIKAQEVIKKHNSLYNFFKSVLGASHTEAQDNACKIEHIVSKDILERIVAFTDYYSKNFGGDFKKKYFS